ncbi:hypothetical protein A2U01_0014097, partial [Trifolium medium]|nr:hypothetical protein [Trifolium medium]
MELKSRIGTQLMDGVSKRVEERCGPDQESQKMIVSNRDQSAQQVLVEIVVS